jgi:hypothetical protein
MMIFEAKMAYNKLRQPEVACMRFFSFLFVGLVLLRCDRGLDADKYLDKHVKSDIEIQATRCLLNGFTKSVPDDENLGIIIGYTEYGIMLSLPLRPANYIA